MNIGIIDADLIDNGTRHPNLALMKISAFQKEQGHTVDLLSDYNFIPDYDKVFISKVFSFTRTPIDIEKYKNVQIGGTGFYMENAPDLPDEIEHHMPDYHLYDPYVGREISRGINPQHFSDYMDYSIGFTTRGCFRKCSFCVNKKYSYVFRHSKVSEFYDKSRKHLYLWDDNILGYSKWQEVIDELEETGRRFQFRQGLDMRIMNEEKAKRLSNVKYHGDYIFAFDHLEDKDIIEKNLKLWRDHCHKTTKLYILCGYDSQDENDIESVLERIKILMKYGCLPYIMRYEDYRKSQYIGIYISLARWCNQPNFFKKKSFREYCEANGMNSSTMRYLNDFEKDHPDISERYFDLKFANENNYSLK